MSVPVIVRPRAELDIRIAREALQKARAGLGIAFVRQVRAVLERIEARPELYAVVWQDVRAARVRRFRHVVYYIAFPDRVEVIAVMHGARDESAWQSRT